MAATADPHTVTRAAALFLSTLSAHNEPTDAEVLTAIRESLLTHGGARGCAADVAARYGDYPELAVPRMRWAKSVVESLDARRHARLPAVPVEHRPTRRHLAQAA